MGKRGADNRLDRNKSELLCSVPGWRTKKKKKATLMLKLQPQFTPLNSPLFLTWATISSYCCLCFCASSAGLAGRLLHMQMQTHTHTHTVSNYVLLHYSCWAILECIKRTSGQEAACVYGVNTAAYIPVNSTYCLFNMLQTLDNPFFFFFIFSSLSKSLGWCRASCWLKSISI